MTSRPPTKLLLTLFVVLVCSFAIPAAAGAATFNVSNTNDVAAANPSSGSCATPSGSAAHGACTLRSAVQAANQVSSSSTINLAPGTYKLTIAPTGADDDSTGDLNLMNTSGAITIAGSGASGTIIDGNFIDRVFSLNSGVIATISGVTIRNGRPGGIGDVTSCPSSQTPEADGGGILDDGTLTLTDDVITGNIAPGGGGGIEDEGGQFFSGRAAQPAGTLSVSGTVISGNKACPNSGVFDGGGGIDITGGSDTIVVDSTVSGNSAQGDGGGIEEEQQPDPTSITNTTISGNTSASSGGGVGTDGGGSFRFYADTLTGNISVNGGGGVEDGGFDTNTYINTTITGNSTQGEGGGVWTDYGSDTLSYSTVTHNTAGGAGNLSTVEPGSRRQVIFFGAVISIDDTIVAEGSGSPSDCTGVTSDGYNLIDTSGQCGESSSNHDIVNADLKLGPLANNGGPTQTEALLQGSPAIDAASLAKCSETANANGQKVDQRGVSRPQGPNCDIGAYEFAEADLAITKTPSTTHPKKGKKLTYTLTVTNNGPDAGSDVTVTDKLPSKLSFVSVKTSLGTCTGGKTVTCQLGTVAVGAQVKITVVVRVHHGGRIVNSASVSGSLPDPDHRNNAATAAVHAKQATCTARLHSYYDSDDRVVKIEIFINGHHHKTLHRNTRTVELTLPTTGSETVRVVFTLSDTREGIVARKFTNCVGGPAQHSSVNPESAPAEP